MSISHTGWRKSHFTILNALADRDQYEMHFVPVLSIEDETLKKFLTFHK